jgi:hypothetical protein
VQTLFLFFAALPPDVREVFDLPEAISLFFFGATPQLGLGVEVMTSHPTLPGRMQAGHSPEEYERVCSGRSKTSRTSGGKAAKNIYKSLRHLGELDQHPV